MFGRTAFAAMRPGAIFISTARGGIHEEGALHAALASGHLAGAGLDVWEKELPAAGHPLLAHPAVIASVHTGGVTHESRGRVPPRVLNPQVLARYAERWSAAFSAVA